jgi:hypothetical protein
MKLGSPASPSPKPNHLRAPLELLTRHTACCQGNPLRVEIEKRAPGRLQEITEQVALVLERRFGSGPIEGKITAHIVSARCRSRAMPRYAAGRRISPARNVRT